MLWSIDIEDKKNIGAAMSEIENHTCIRFRLPTPDDYNWLEFQYGPVGCHSFVGRQQDKGPQKLVLAHPYRTVRNFILLLKIHV